MFALSRRDRRKRLRLALSRVLFRIRSADVAPASSAIAIADARIQLARVFRMS